MDDTYITENMDWCRTPSTREEVDAYVRGWNSGAWWRIYVAEFSGGAYVACKLSEDGDPLDHASLHVGMILTLETHPRVADPEGQTATLGGHTVVEVIGGDGMGFGCVQTLCVGIIKLDRRQFRRVRDPSRR